MKKTLRVLLALALVALGIFAAIEAAFADEASVRKTVEEKLGAKVDSVSKTAYGGLYEVYANGQIVYVDDKAGFMLAGPLLDLKSNRNITAERMEKLSAINFSELPLDLAVKTVRGKGTRILATFEDPNCGYCKRMAKDLQTLDDVTIYTFLYPILSEDSNTKAKQIWCSADKAKAWNEWMVGGVAPSGEGKCEHPTEKIVALGQKLRVNGTPTLFFANGERVGGAIPAAQIDKRLKQVAAGGKGEKSAAN